MSIIKHRLFSVLCILTTFLGLIVLPALAAAPLIENWDTTPALPNSWGRTFEGDVQQYVDTANKELHMIVRPYIPTSGQSRARVRFAAPDTVSSISTTITLKSINYASGMEDTSAQIAGIFYNKNENSADALGDVFAALRVGDRGNGLEAWLYVTESADADFIGVINPVEVHLADLSDNTDYTVTFSYDGDKTFTGTISGPGVPETSETIEGPARIGAGSTGFLNFKELRARVYSGSGLTADPDKNKLHVAFGPVSINGGATGSYDPFNTTLQSSLWREPEGTATVTGSELKLQVKSAPGEEPKQRVQTQVGLPTEYDAYTYIQADLKIDDIAVGIDSLAQVTLKKTWGNGLYNENPGDPEWDGTIASYSSISKGPGHDFYSVSCGFEMDDPNNTVPDPPGSEYFTDRYVEIVGGWVDKHSEPQYEVFPNTVYTFALKRVGTIVSCTVKEKNSGKILIDVSENILNVDGIDNFYAVARSQGAQVRVRARNKHPTETIGYVDNICIGMKEEDCPRDGFNILFMLPPMGQPEK